MNKQFLLLLIFFFLSNISIAQFQIGHQSFSITDPNRGDREVFGEIYYPADVAGDDVAVANGQFPVIIFGHGFLTIWSEYSVWWEALVPQCYIMIFPRTEGNIAPNHDRFGEDLAFLGDHYIAENDNTGSPFFGKINENIAIMGHSMGGGASFLAAENNSNIKTMITLAAAETNSSAIGAASNIQIPSLTIAGENDCVAPPNDHQILMYNALSSNYKSYVEITDASHCQFGLASGGSNCRTGELLSCFFTSYISSNNQHEYMLALSTPWLDYYLKNDCEAFEQFHTYMTTASTHTYSESGSTPMPLPVPDITQNGTNLSTTTIGEYDYQWYLDGTEIPGATNDNYVYTQAGDYQIEIKNAENCTAISAITTIVVALPITLSSFDLKVLQNREVAITWKTESEFDNDYFDIEHSTDQFNFKKIVQIKGQGNTTEVVNYSFVHDHPIVGNNYYRLKQVDLDGRYQYFDWKQVAIENEKGISLKLFPNPIQEQLFLQLSVEKDQEVTIHIIDALGKTIYSFDQQLNNGVNDMVFSVPDLYQGLHFIHVSGTQIDIVKRFIKK